MGAPNVRPKAFGFSKRLWQKFDDYRPKDHPIERHRDRRTRDQNDHLALLQMLVGADLRSEPANDVIEHAFGLGDGIGPTLPGIVNNLGPDDVIDCKAAPCAPGGKTGIAVPAVLESQNLLLRALVADRERRHLPSPSFGEYRDAVMRLDRFAQGLENA